MDIERAVGAALKPSRDVDLRAHRILLDLSRDTAGRVRLVTTNFDLLFEMATPKLPAWTPAHLPQFRAIEGFEGIVHLHGMFDAAYERPVGGSLVLSSAEFGRAYLAEGWATNFIRSVVQNYRVVFVGYAADDPPVQYLLEALNRATDAPPSRLYAFQSGRADEARVLWAQKGVTAIAYNPDNRHAALWQTLAAWGERAANPERWRQKLLRRAAGGPQALQPHERGQIVHLAMTEDGARSIAQAKSAVPASWICAFDPAIRYSPPARLNLVDEGSPCVDFFADYGLDSDPRPEPGRSKQLHPRLEIPDGGIDVMMPTTTDQRTMLGRFRGRDAIHMSELPPRLLSLAWWFQRICQEPAAIWWAAGQDGLHPKVVELIAFALNQGPRTLTAETRSAWRYLFEGWRTPRGPDYTSVFALKAALDRDGWTRQHLRRFAETFRPTVTSSRPYWRGHFPRHSKGTKLRDLVNVDVQYPNRHVPIAVPDEQLSNAVPLLRQNLELAVDLEREISPRTVPHVASIDPDPTLAGMSSDRETGINVAVLEFAGLFERYAKGDPASARTELDAWRTNDDPVFGRLRVWATRLPNLLDDRAAAELLVATHDAILWGSRDRRDVLLALRDCWNRMPADLKATIEKRLLEGPPSYPAISARDNRKHKAWAILERVRWLQREGCAFGSKSGRRLHRLESIVPRFAHEGGAHAADSLESRGGFVTTDKSIGKADEVPISELISWALKGRGRVWGKLQEIDPFAGLCEIRPVRVLTALRYETQKGSDVAPAWIEFLQSSARRTDKPTFAALVARRLAVLPISAIVRPVSYWLGSAHKLLFERDRQAFEVVFDKLADALAVGPLSGGVEAIAESERRDWPSEALGSAAGHLCDALFGDPVLPQLKGDEPLPTAWLTMAERLLSLPGNHRRFSLVLFARRLAWLHIHSGEWSERLVLSALGEEEANRDAMLAGFFLSPLVGDERLYGLLKPTMIELAAGKSRSQNYSAEGVARFCIGGWLTRKSDGGRWLSDDEFRRVLISGSDTLRMHALWQVGHFEEIDEKVSFLRGVWPLQLSARTPSVVSRLVALTFDDEAHFPELADAILPLVGSSDARGTHFVLLGEKNERIIARYPDIVLELLARTLGTDVANWPYGVGQMLERLLKLKPTFAEDARFVRLKGTWDKR